MGREGEKEGLLAVLLGDLYSNNLAPLTITSPLSLLPVAGRPLLDITLDSLRLAGVTEVLLYLSSHPGMVKSWLASSRWSSQPSPLTITIIVNEECMSVGDACRDLDEKGVVRGDFLLVGAGLIAGGGLCLDLALERHKQRVSKDKHAVMTALYTLALPGEQSRESGQEVVLATDKHTGQVLFYQRSGNTAYNFPIELFQHDQVELSFDLGDPFIAVCHPTVLALFSDNFDLQTLDALTSEILESDLVDSTVYMERLEGRAVGRVISPHSLLEVEQRLLERWFHPQVVDQAGSQITMGRHSVYKGRDSSLAGGVLLKEGVLVSSGSKVGSKAILERSTVGAGAVLGQGCLVKDSIVMEGAVIGNGVHLDQVIVGRGAVVKEGSRLNSRCLVGEGVILEASVIVPELTRISAAQEDDWGEDGGDDKLGEKAFLYTEEDEDEEEEEEEEMKKDWWGSAYEEAEDGSSEGMSEGSSEGDDEEEEEEESEEEGGEHDDVKNFRREVIESIERGGDTDNLVLEINGSKHAWNITLSEVNQCVIYAVLTNGVDTSQPPAALLTAATANIKKFLGLLRKYCSGANKQGYYLAGLETLVARDSAWLEVLHKVLHFLYDKDVLEDAVIIDWMEGEGEDKDVKDKMRNKCKAFIQWLEEADSESEED